MVCRVRTQKSAIQDKNLLFRTQILTFSIGFNIILIRVDRSFLTDNVKLEVLYEN